MSDYDRDAGLGGGGGGVIYGLEFQCRALAAVEAAASCDCDRSQFLVGTQGLKASVQNQVHLVEVDDGSGGGGGGGRNGDRAASSSSSQSIVAKTVFGHPAGEVWDICTSSKNPNHFVTRYSSVENNACRMGAALWDKRADEGGRDSEDEAGGEHGAATKGLKRVGDLAPDCDSDVGGVAWMPGDDRTVMVWSENRLSLHDVSVVEDSRRCKVVACGRLEGKAGHTSFSAGAWNPHQNCQQFCTVNDQTARGWDVRSMDQAWTLETQHAVRCVDFNPNKQYHMATAGDDGCVRFWDIRRGGDPLATRSDHSHWVWSVRFNQFHDQLVLTTSSDCHVMLSCLSSISSEPHGHLVDDDDDDDDEEPSSPALEDGVLKVFDDHEESVYVGAWSSADPWTFASLSYDGRLVINTVPKHVKFSILQLV